MAKNNTITKDLVLWLHRSTVVLCHTQNDKFFTDLASQSGEWQKGSTAEAKQ